MTFPADTALDCAVHPAANHEARAPGEVIDMLIVHYTGMPDAQVALDWLCAAESRVSCHYMVFEDGRIVQMVPEDRRAWHAGKAFWRGHRDINSRSIGIEVANPGHEHGYVPFTAAQMQAVTGLARDIVGRHAIAARNVLAHSDVAPTRKCDPGELFDWAGLYKNGVGHWVKPEPLGAGRFFQPGDGGAPVAALQAMLALYGYDIAENGRFDEAMQAVVGAFQRHFRPERVDGIADQSTITTLHRLLKALAGEGALA